MLCLLSGDEISTDESEKTKEQMKNTQPLISVLMPVYNAGEFLVEAIESILAQTYENWELLAVDGGSKDNSLEILKKYTRKDSRIKIIQNGNHQGIGHSLNLAIPQTKGDYIARMDADDISLPNRFEEQIKLLEKNPHLVACGGQAEMIDEKSQVFAEKRFPTDPKVLRQMIMKMIPLQHPILMARAKVLKKYRYLENLPTAEDVDMLFYLLSNGDLGNVNKTIYQYRKADNSNAYQNVKKTFYITFFTRLRAIKKYCYRPTISGVLISMAQFILISLLPSKLVISLFETLRYRRHFYSLRPKLSLQPALG